jgi:hypothetical protein
VDGTSLGTLTATDANPVDEHTFTVVTPNTPFSVEDGNVLTVTDESKLDYEAQSAWPINIKVTDSTGLTYTQGFTMTVVDINEAPTGIWIHLPGNPSSSVTSMDENTAKDTVIAHVSVEDDDVGDSHGLYLVDSTNSFRLVHGNQLMVARDGVNHEVTGVITVIITAQDQALPTGNVFTQSIDITINNVPEAPTQVLLSKYEPAPHTGMWFGDDAGVYFWVFENMPVNTNMGRLTTTDDDNWGLGADATPVNTFTYTLADPSKKFGLMASDDGTGIDLVTKAVLDFEARVDYAVTVVVTDSDGLEYK